MAVLFSLPSCQKSDQEYEPDSPQKRRNDDVTKVDTAAIIAENVTVQHSYNNISPYSYGNSYVSVDTRWLMPTKITTALYSFFSNEEIYYGITARYKGETEFSDYDKRIQPPSPSTKSFELDIVPVYINDYYMEDWLFDYLYAVIYGTYNGTDANLSGDELSEYKLYWKELTKKEKTAKTYWEARVYVEIGNVRYYVEKDIKFQ